MSEKIYLKFWESRSQSSEDRNVELAGIKLVVCPGVFNPDSDLTDSTSVILDNMGSQKGLKALDLGCGSGIIALKAAEMGADFVLAVDIDKHAIYCTESNKKLNGLEDKVMTLRGDLFDSIHFRFDRIYANLPILDILALENYKRLMSSYENYLNEGGELWLSYASFGDKEYLERTLKTDTRLKECKVHQSHGVEWILLRYGKSTK